MFTNNVGNNANDSTGQHDNQAGPAPSSEFIRIKDLIANPPSSRSPLTQPDESLLHRQIQSAALIAQELQALFTFAERQLHTTLSARIHLLINEVLGLQAQQSRSGRGMDLPRDVKGEIAVLVLQRMDHAKIVEEKSGRTVAEVNAAAAAAAAGL